ncbi:MAG: LacI family DNA-binding transcriptional regulator [Bacteroidota bacterium]
MSKRRTTLADIAEALDMSPSTVSRALAGHERISVATRRTVREMADRLKYRQNSLAASLRNGKTRLIGVLMPTINRSFFASVVRGIEDVAGPAGYSIVVTQNDDEPQKESSALDALIRAQVDGVIASLSRNTTDYSSFSELSDRRVPLVLFDRVSDRIQASQVTIDDYHGAFLATQHLIDQGCRYPVHLGGPQHLNIYQDRLNGFREAIEQAGLPFNPYRQIMMIDHTAEGGKQAAEELLARSDPPDAIFSASDWAATGAMRHLLSKGVRIPEDIAVVGFANESFTAFLEPSLTTVEQFSRKIGQEAATILMQQLEQSGTPKARKVRLKPELIVRRSSLRTQ